MGVPEINPDDLHTFPVVRLDSDVEGRIADLVEKASELRMHADDEENQAVDELDSYLDTLLGSEGETTVGSGLRGSRPVAALERLGSAGTCRSCRIRNPLRSHTSILKK